jgi:hypothetical protein
MVGKSKKRRGSAEVFKIFLCAFYFNIKNVNWKNAS